MSAHGLRRPIIMVKARKEWIREWWLVVDFLFSFLYDQPATTRIQREEMVGVRKGFSKGELV